MVILFDKGVMFKIELIGILGIPLYPNLTGTQYSDYIGLKSSRNVYAKLRHSNLREFFGNAPGLLERFGKF